MSINNSNCGNGIIIFNGERLLIFYDHCEIKFEKYSPSIDLFCGSKNGSVYLTSHRIVFINKNLYEQLQSISMPFVALKKVDIKQPVFGANRVEGFVTAEPNGGFQGTIQFSITFKHGGAIEFGQALLEAGRRTTRGQPPWNPPDTFFSIPVGVSYYAAPPPAYAPPYQDPYYNFVPQHESFMSPNGAQIFMYGAPPPYPGACPYPVNPSQNGAFPQPQGPLLPPPPHANYEKELEANQQQPPGYYSVTNPHDVYVATATAPPNFPNGNTPSAPPAYSYTDKKNN